MDDELLFIDALRASGAAPSGASLSRPSPHAQLLAAYAHTFRNQMNNQTMTDADLAAQLTMYCQSCLALERRVPRGDPAAVQAIARSIATTAQASGYSAAALFQAFGFAWEHHPDVNELTYALQSAAYCRALTLLTEKFIDTA